MSDETVEVVVVRHGPKAAGSGKNVIAPEVPLKDPEGVEFTRNVMAPLYKGRCDKIYTSPLVRAVQTAFLLQDEWVMNGLPHVVNGLAGELTKWGEILPRLTSFRCVDFYEAEPLFFQDEGDDLFHSIQDVARQTPFGGHAVCVSHGGLIEAAMAHALASLERKTYFDAIRSIRDLKEGEGVVFKFAGADTHFVGFEEVRLPKTS